MNNNLKRFTSLALIIVLMMSVFAGCSNNANEATNELPEATSSSNAGGDQFEESWKNNTDPITFSWYLNFSWFPNKWGTDLTSQYITDKTGVNIDFVVPAGNENEKLNTMIASDTLPDFVTLGWWEGAVDTMIEGDLVYGLDELADKYDTYFYQVADDGRLSWYTKEDGHVYGYPNASFSPQDYDKYDVTSNQTFLVRKDMYEAIGSPDMRTPEGFLSALEKAQEMFPEVNGQPLIPLGLHEFGTTGQYANYSLEDFLKNFLAISREENGLYTDRTDNDEYITWLKTFREANEKGLLATDIFIDKRPQMEEKIAQGRYFAMLYQRSDCAAQQNILYANDPDGVYIAVDGPANSKMEDPTLAGQGIAGWTITLISKNVEDPERAIQFMSYLMSEEGQKDMYLGPEGVTYDVVDEVPTLKPEVLELLNTDRSAFDKKYGSISTFWMLMDNPMLMQWEPEPSDPLAQPMNWTKGKTVYFAQYDNIDPLPDTDLGISLDKIKRKWSEALPKMLLAENEAEFDKIFNAFLEYREENGYKDIVEYQQQKIEENKERLGM